MPLLDHRPPALPTSGSCQWRLRGRHLPTHRHLAPPLWAQALLREEAPDSGRGVRPWLDLRREKIIATGSSKGARSLCSRHARRAAQTHGGSVCYINPVMPSHQLHGPVGTAGSSHSHGTQSLSPKGASAVLPNSQGESQADGACLGQHSEKGWGLTCQSLATMSPFNPGVTGR